MTDDPGGSERQRRAEDAAQRAVGAARRAESASGKVLALYERLLLNPDLPPATRDAATRAMVATEAASELAGEGFRGAAAGLERAAQMHDDAARYHTRRAVEAPAAGPGHRAEADRHRTAGEAARVAAAGDRTAGGLAPERRYAHPS